MAKLLPIVNNAQFINGVPANGAKLFFYAAGSSTKQTTYADEAGTIPQTNPVILDSRGEPSQPIWGTEGLSYKIVFTSSTDSDPPVSSIWDIDNVTGINDASVALDQWVDSGVTPTYVSATQFTLPGDQTSAFQIGRRVKVLVTAGTAYGYITASVFGALTTVTVEMDSTPLDSGLSTVQLGLLTYTNPSIPKLTTVQYSDLSVTSAKLADDAVTAAKLADSSLGFSMINGKIVGSVGSNALTVAVKTLAGNDPSASDPVLVLFRNATLTDGSYSVVSITAATTLVVSSGSTLGTLANILANLVVLLINNAGTAELAISNLSGGVNLDGTGIISTTAEGGAGAADSATVIYSTTARSNVAYRPVALMEITEAVAGTWATAHTKLTPLSNPQALMSLGYGQTWQSFARISGTTYYNTTGKPILVFTRWTGGSASGSLTINGVALNTSNGGGSNADAPIYGIVPPGQSYLITTGTGVLATTVELR